MEYAEYDWMESLHASYICSAASRPAVEAPATMGLASMATHRPLRASTLSDPAAGSALMRTVAMRAASLAVPGASNMGVAARRIGPVASASSSSVWGLGSPALATGTSDTAGPTSTATSVAPS